MKRIAAAMTAALLATTPLAVQAEGLALVIGNSDYAAAPDAVTAFNDTRRVARVLEEAGYKVLRGSDLDREAFSALLQDFAQRTGKRAPLVIYYSGHAMRAGGQTYLAPTDLDPKNLVDVTLNAVPLDLVTGLAGAAPGRAVVFLDVAQYRGFTPTDFAEPGMAEVEDSAGILVVSAAAPGRAKERKGKTYSAFNKLIADALLAPGAKLAEAVEAAGDRVWVSGTVEERIVLVTPPAPETVSISAQIEQAFWDAATATGRKEDYEAYLTRYPEGTHAAAARKKLGMAAAGAPDPAAKAEKALRLTRSERRQVQESLALLGHDPKGIDGIFGPVTRAALSEWQGANGHKVTGYLTDGQYSRILKQGTRAKRDLAVRLEREDRQYWQETGGLRTAAGYRAYLARYPDGVNADRAIAQLERLAAKSERAEEKAERQAFKDAEKLGTAAAYRGFLRTYPDGNYAAAAKRAMKVIANKDAFARNAEKEKRLGLDKASRQSLEQRLAFLGFHPGPQDGAFDGNTRKAVRKYQEDRGLNATGFFDRDTVALVVEETSRSTGSGNVLQNLIGAISRR
ncbi:MAG: peptidoglycan-binding protein [Pseudomonadota bacterium]